MMNSFKFLALLLAIALFPVGAMAQTDPAPASGLPSNLYFGAVPPAPANAPVILFVHGLRGRAQDWWVGNDMYKMAYQFGYRTAFININADGTANDASIANNAAVIAPMIQMVAQKYNVAKLWLVTHSKGGIDTQASILYNPPVIPFVQGVFTLSTPNRGTELADWAFGAGAAIAQPLGLQTPGVFALQKPAMGIFREFADPRSAMIGIHYYYMAGTTPDGNPLTEITGAVLKGLSPISSNDGLVTIGDNILPISYASNLGLIYANHFRTNNGSLAFPRIHAQIQAEVALSTFSRNTTASGFGDRQNSFAWSMTWWKGQLYVGTARAFLCVTAATADASSGSSFYKPSSPDVQCAPTPQDLPLRAEIWRFTPETKVWQRVYQAPQDVPVEFNSSGVPTKFTGRDIAYRGMTVFTEADGTQALYVAGVGGSGVFDKLPPYANPETNPYPPPRILRSTDGVNFAPLPQTPGTFLGDIYKKSTNQRIRVRGFRSLTSYKGKLFVTASDFRGVGFLIASSNPAAGNDAWFQASPSPDVLPIWTTQVYNNYLYFTTGDNQVTAGYGVYKTDAAGNPPYAMIPVVVDGAGQIASQRARDALSLAELNGFLFVGSDRPTEMIRIHKDDTWDLVVGAPRNTPQGFKVPISGHVTGFGNIFNGHFWRMATHNGRLYAGTWDWSMTLRNFPSLAPLLDENFGADFFSTAEGIFWKIETRTGFGDRFNYGIRTLQPTPLGLFVGTANPFYGLQVLRDPFIMDYNKDRRIDQRDLQYLTSAINQTVPPGDPRDLDEDGKITVLDTRKLTTQCTSPGCAISTAPLPAIGPQKLQSAPRSLSGTNVTLSWNAVPGATGYNVYRVDPIPILSVLPPDTAITIPGTTTTFTVSQIQAGVADSYCAGVVTSADCEMLQVIKKNQPIPAKAKVVATLPAGTLTFQEPIQVAGQALYYVKAVLAAGALSTGSNLVAGPSETAAARFASLGHAILAAGERRKADWTGELHDLLIASSAGVTARDFDAATTAARQLQARAAALREKHSLIGADWAEVEQLAEQLERNILLVQKGHLSAEQLLRGHDPELTSKVVAKPAH